MAYLTQRVTLFSSCLNTKGGSANTHAGSFQVAAPDWCVANRRTSQRRACDDVLDVFRQRPPVSQAGSAGKQVWIRHRGISQDVHLGSGKVPNSHVEHLATISESSSKRMGKT